MTQSMRFYGAFFQTTKEPWTTTAAYSACRHATLSPYWLTSAQTAREPYSLLHLRT